MEVALKIGAGAPLGADEPCVGAPDGAALWVVGLADAGAVEDGPPGAAP